MSINVKEELPCCLPAIGLVQDSWNKVLDDKSSESDALDNISNESIVSFLDCRFHPGKGIGSRLANNQVTCQDLLAYIRK